MGGAGFKEVTRQTLLWKIMSSKELRSSKSNKVHFLNIDVCKNVFSFVSIEISISA